jgi:signal transduction histidine kinase
VSEQDSGIGRLRFAIAVIVLAASALIIGQKHLLARPWPGLLLVLAAALPFVIDALWPERLGATLLGARPPLASAIGITVAGATALLFYRPADGDAAVLFFIASAARVGAAVSSRISIPAGVSISVVPLVASRLGGSYTPVMAAIGAAFAWVAGSAIRAQSQTAAKLIEAQAAVAHHQIAAERQQLAREFHDLVGHTLSVTMLHMTAVRMSLEDGESGEALESLDMAQRAGREAMREMRQTVMLLGSAPSDGPPPALPHVRDLHELVAEYTAAGLEVKLDAEGDLTAIPGDVGLAAYRIAQESLTNAAKHAPGSVTRVQITNTAVELRLAVSNDIDSSPPPISPLPGSGHGIAGMTQRARLAGGDCSSGPDGRHWRVEAFFPVGDRS